MKIIVLNRFRLFSYAARNWIATDLNEITMKLNEKELVKLSVLGEITSAVWPAARSYRPGGDGVNRVLPGTGGICYSHQIGDSAVKLAADHVEPGVSIRAKDNNDNAALNTLACVGNEAVVISGDARRSKGVVCGTHGGVNHVMLDFSTATLKKLCIGDRIQIKSYGVGLELRDLPEVKIFNSDPGLIKKWGLKVARKKLQVPVSHIIPAALMGSGLGQVSCHSGDYDIQMFDEPSVKKHKLNSLRFGDLVAIEDTDHSYGRRYLSGAISIGVIVHSRSDMSGHGPGVTSLLTSKDGLIQPVVKKDANIGSVLKIGRWRR